MLVPARPSRNTGVVDENVQTAEFLDCRSAEFLNHPRLGDVAHHGYRMHAKRLYLGRRLRRDVLLQVGHDYVSAFSGERERDGLAYARGAAGDYRYLIV